MRTHPLIYSIFILTITMTFGTTSRAEQTASVEMLLNDKQAVAIGSKLPLWPTRLCGNGVLNHGESCDDHDNDDGDGCSRYCIVEQGWQCAPTCKPIHGDGLVVGPEICDDGNTRDDDYCDVFRNRTGDLAVVGFNIVVGMPLSGDAESANIDISNANYNEPIEPELIPTGQRMVAVGNNAIILEGGIVWPITRDTPQWTIFDYAAQGLQHGCGLHPDGTMDCWGYGDEQSADCQSDRQCGQAIPLEGVFDHVAVGPFHSCAVRSSDRHIECWGYGPHTAAPEGLFDRVAIKYLNDMNWGLTLDNRIVSSSGVEPWPSDRFTDIAAGSYFICGVTTRQDLKCRGDDINLNEPGFVAVSANLAVACGLSSQGIIRCWLLPPPPT